MIFRIARILEAKRPEFAVLENVKGILNHDGGKTVRSVFALLTSKKYFVRMVLLNSAHYGSAQSRERVLFLCSRSDFSEKNPVVVDDTKRFRDVRQDFGPFKTIKDDERNRLKLEQKRGSFNFELVGGWDRVGTLTTQAGCGEKAAQERDGTWRMLTPLECERLQGFPDGWTAGAPDSARYFALGNAVNCRMSSYLFGNYLKGVWWK